ncbi:MAG TPA: MFS transporter [Candidatus Limnocylindrales bacterium]|nr:MFS transporter [Candidatus Limnocylindrales bacterium]
MSGQEVSTEPVEVVPLRRNRDFQLLWIGQAASSLGTQVATVAFPLLVLAVTGSAAQAGLVGFALTLPLFAFSLPAGALVDRWNRRRVMLISDGVRAIALGTVVLAVATKQVTISHLVVVAFLVGTFAVFFDLADTAALRFLVPTPQVSSAVAQVQARENAAWLVGGPLGGFLFGVARFVPFLFDAISYLIGVVTTLAIRRQFQAERTEPPGNVLAEMWQGLRWVWREPYLRMVAVVAAAANGVTQAMVLIMIFVAEGAGASPTQIGLMLACAGLGGLAGALASPLVLRVIPPTVIVVGLNWLWVLLLPVIIFVRNPFVLGGLAAVLAFGYPAWNSITVAKRLRIIPEEMLGRAQSVHRLLGASTVPLGALLSGLLYENFGVVVSVIAFAAVMLVVAISASLSRALRG